MDVEARLDALIRLAEQIGIDVRYETMDGNGGGLCVLRGRRVLFVDTSAEPEQRYERLVRALAPLPELDNLYIAPELREELDAGRPP